MVTADVTAANEQITALEMSLRYLSTGSFPITITVNGFAVAAQNAADMRTLLTAIVKTWTATIAISGFVNAIQNATDVRTALQAIVKTWSAIISVLAGSALSTISSVLSGLRSIDGYTATASITTTRTTIFDQIGAAAATGGWRKGGQSVLVGEEGPEVVWFPTNGYVYTAPETAQMASLMSGASQTSPNITSPSFGASSSNGDTITSVKGGDIHLHGDVIIADQKSAKTWWDEMDRRTGKKNEMAKRGMVPTDGNNW
jgi:phage-related minor tail protein